ncbi:putative ATP synthase subunit f, mitochondrial [Vespa crabro]|uniref:putative ATP synthase subunit f, mitochondrial n=1 Tax=Vespa crabro TaxID=7445 RepID=UPI001F0085E2|nr:putative ATP synthase subunit f, mitochondrial [Vespa crabro]
MGFGDYPAEYDRAKHGPYDPARYYGKPDTPLGDVKIGEFGAWIRRRNFHPQAIVSACSRAFWRWQHKYVFPERAGGAHFFQMAVGLSILFYIINYQRIKTHKNYKYH